MYLHHCILPAYIQNAPFRCFWTYWAMLFVRYDLRGFGWARNAEMHRCWSKQPRTLPNTGVKSEKIKNLLMSWQSCCCFTQFVVLACFDPVWQIMAIHVVWDVSTIPNLWLKRNAGRHLYMFWYQGLATVWFLFGFQRFFFVCRKYGHMTLENCLSQCIQIARLIGPRTREPTGPTPWCVKWIWKSGNYYRSVYHYITS